MELSSFDTKVLSTNMQRIDSLLQEEDELSVDHFDLEELARNHRILWNVLQSVSSLSREDNYQSAISACDRHIEELDKMIDIEQDTRVLESLKKNKQTWQRLQTYVTEIRSLFRE